MSIWCYLYYLVQTAGALIATILLAIAGLREESTWLIALTFLSSIVTVHSLMMLARDGMPTIAAKSAAPQEKQ